jgi:hypothetical protein
MVGGKSMNSRGGLAAAFWLFFSPAKFKVNLNWPNGIFDTWYDTRRKLAMSFGHVGYVIPF